MTTTWKRIRRIISGRIDRKIAFFFSLTVICLIGLSTYANYLQSRQIIQQETISHLKTMLELKANIIEISLQHTKNRILDFSSDTRLSECMLRIQANETGCTAQELSLEFREKKLPLFTELIDLLAVGLDGTVIASSFEEDIGIDRSQNSYFIRGKEGISIQ